MSVVPVINYAAELAIAAIILYYVVEMLPMPVNMRRVVQALILLVVILDVIAVAVGADHTPVRSLIAPPAIIR